MEALLQHLHSFFVDTSYLEPSSLSPYKLPPQTDVTPPIATSNTETRSLVFCKLCAIAQVRGAYLRLVTMLKPSLSPGLSRLGCLRKVDTCVEIAVFEGS